MFKLKARRKIRGHIDALSSTVAEGWVMHRTQRNKRLGVEVRLRDRVIASGQADVFRADLLANGFGDGRYGFNIALPPGLSDTDCPSMRVFEVETGTEIGTYNAAISPSNIIEFGALWNLLFDKNYYIMQISQLKGEPLPEDFADHFRKKGWKLGLNPHPLFDTTFYVEQLSQPIVGDPISHFLEHGQHQFLSPHPLCDINFYYNNRMDVRDAGIHPLIHYLQNGDRENLRMSPLFDDDGYNHVYVNTRGTADVGKTREPILLHYLKFGWREGLRPHTSFDPLLYQRLVHLDAGIEPYSDFLKTLMRQNAIRPDAGRLIRFTIVILNLNKTMLTLQCLVFLRMFTALDDCEIVIVDNGSGWDEFSLLCQYGLGAQIIRLERNLGFGEGNNVGTNVARGEFLVFLNNDAFVTNGWLEPLVTALETDPSVGAAGPKFLYADGTLQEAGSTLSSCGASIQRGRGLDASNELFNESCVVDYCSAATLIMRTESFRRILGYDLCFDPAYYEDADLCLKLRLIDQKVLYVPKSQVVHLEHATAGDRSLGLAMESVSQTNRIKFVARWGSFLAGRSDGTTERQLVPNRPASSSPKLPAHLKRLGLYSPYPLTPGGGERYLLSLAAVLRADYSCTLFTPDRHSRERLATLARELDLPLDHVAIESWKNIGQAEKFDVFICMSNEMLPSVPAIGRLNIFLCQFPFPMLPGVYARDWGNLNGYDAMIVYSQFVVDHVAQAAERLGLKLPPCHILSPPVPQVLGLGQPPEVRDPIRIVNVGRFTPAGHCKRQDVMIEAFREVVEQVQRPLELHLVGALGSLALDRDYLASLQRAARDLPVSFHLNVTPEQIHTLYRRASVYWHMTGANDDVRHKPERFEHFGITIGEAMSAGVIPISLRYGGPSEIITDATNGFLVSDAGELRDRTISLLSSTHRQLTDMRNAARHRAKDFSMEKFEAHLRSIINNSVKFRT